jgi:hypothetical protein
MGKRVHLYCLNGSGGSFLFQENIGTHEVCIIGTCVANEGDLIQSRVGDSPFTKTLQAFPNKDGAIDSQLLLITRITGGSARVQNLIFVARS